MPRFEDYGRGAGIRAEKREFREETATALAASKMAEVKRRELGATRRERLVEVGRMTRDVTGEAGTERRHLRRFGPGGSYLTGIERSQIGQTKRARITEAGCAASATERLSAVIEAREEERSGDIYSAGKERLLSPLVEEDGGISDEIRDAWLESDEAEARKPGSGLKLLRKRIAKYKEKVAGAAWLDSLGEMPLSELKRMREQLISYPITRENRLSEAR